MNVWHYIFFLLIMTSILGVGQLYIWRRLVRDPALPRPWTLALSGLVIAFLLIVPATFFMMRGVPRETLAPFAFLAFGWMGMLSTLVVVLLSSDALRFLVNKLRGGADEHNLNNPERRATLGRLFAGGVAATSSTIVGAGVANVIAGFSVVEVEVTLDKLPKTFDGFRIVQLSDVHVGPTIGRDFVTKMVEAANGLTPDLVALTGDFVDGSVKNLARHTEPLKDLKAAHGSYFVTGNHEYYSGADDWIRELERLGIPTLRNRAVRLKKGNDAIVLAGVTDHRAERYGDAPDLHHALRHRRPEEEVVLLAHQPREITEAQKHDVGLQLSGHTHGGQFWPWNWVVHLLQPVVAGLARFGRTQIYVNSGTGYWGPPMRLGTESEITLVILRSA